ncbi:MAG: tyrosine-type recombinase/integrase [Candidatus Thermoplasmatota archaeon]|nr:tyrosine-type recombinase/integrase [Candidatus Thermoplasmatota archaeon]
MNDFSKFEEWFLDHNYDGKTIRNARGDMRRITRVREINTRDDFVAWLREMRLNGMRNVTINHYLRTVNQYCTMMGWEKFPYAREARSMKIKTVTKDEMKAILGTPSGYTKARDSAVLYLIFGCGLRIGEVCNLKLSDVASMDTGVINVTGKNQKTRTVYLPSEVRKALKAYLADRMQTDQNYLFTGPKGRLKYDYLRQRVSRIAARAGIHFSAHMGRHTYATAMLRNGVSIYSVSRLLGHSDLGTTEVYLHLNQQEAVEEVKSKMKDFFRINEKEVPIYEIANRI